MTAMPISYSDSGINFNFSMFSSIQYWYWIRFTIIIGCNFLSVRKHLKSLLRLWQGSLMPRWYSWTRIVHTFAYLFTFWRLVSDLAVRLLIWSFSLSFSRDILNFISSSHFPIWTWTIRLSADDGVVSTPFSLVYIIWLVSTGPFKQCKRICMII